MEGVLDDFTSHATALNYFFFNFRAGELSFLVDFIQRRGDDESVELRLSYWVRGAGRVERESGSPLTRPNGVVATGFASLDRDRSAGSVGDCRWDLGWTVGNARVHPTVPILGALHPGDLDIVIYPAARFEGWVEVAGERFDVRNRPGTFTHYWGRRLADRWVWVSAAEFPGEPDRRVEALQAWTRTWGRGPSYPFGYVWSTDGQHEDLTISPVTGLVTVRWNSDDPGVRTVAGISSAGIGRTRHRLEVSAPSSSFNDLGEGIRQTLLADLAIDGIQAVPATVGFERR